MYEERMREYGRMETGTKEVKVGSRFLGPPRSGSLFELNHCSSSPPCTVHALSRVYMQRPQHHWLPFSCHFLYGLARERRCMHSFTGKSLSLLPSHVICQAPSHPCSQKFPTRLAIISDTHSTSLHIHPPSACQPQTAHLVPLIYPSPPQSVHMSARCLPLARSCRLFPRHVIPLARTALPAVSAVPSRNLASSASPQPMRDIMTGEIIQLPEIDVSWSFINHYELLLVMGRQIAKLIRLSD